MYQAIIIIHILLGLSIIGLVLMQQGKGADAGATFGGGASGSVFGAQGAASFLSRTTAILATMFFMTSLGLAWLNSHKSGGVNDLMSTTAVEKEVPDLGLPPVNGVKPEVIKPPSVNSKPAENNSVAPASPSDKPAVEGAAPSAETSKPAVTDQPKSDATPNPSPEQEKKDVAAEKKEAEHKIDAPAKATHKKKK
ncbi:MAG: preprotein translocase subunit SecG [Gammaproteobacteria bacterium]|nr:preprotein translocase subunit SecG [Gammaproteobacteria bacterium]